MAKDSTFPEIAPILMQAARGQLAAMTARLEARGFKGLTPAFATAMPLLDAAGTRSTILAQRAGVTKQAMSQLVKLLEERKYVEQVPDPADTRAKVVRLTKRGIALRAACAQIRRELHSAALKALGEKDLAKLVLDLRKLIASMSAR
jgi:DNA-binding MarR family transcriptional regulator